MSKPEQDEAILDDVKAPAELRGGKPAIEYVALITDQEVARRLRARIVSEGFNARQWAAKEGWKYTTLCAILRGDRRAPEELAKVVGLVPVRGYRDPEFRIKPGHRPWVTYKRRDRRPKKASPDSP